MGTRRRTWISTIVADRLNRHGPDLLYHYRKPETFEVDRVNRIADICSASLQQKD